MRKLCLAGGVALNCVANGRILREGPFDDIWIQPAAGDAGGALGVALFIWHHLLGHSRTVRVQDAQRGSFLGPRWSDDEIQVFLDGVGAPRDDYADDQALCEAVAELIAAGTSGRLVPGTDGVRAARPRIAQHPGRSARPQDAVAHERTDQVPGVVPSLRAGRAA